MAVFSFWVAACHSFSVCARGGAREALTIHAAFDDGKEGVSTEHRGTAAGERGQTHTGQHVQRHNNNHKVDNHVRDTPCHGAAAPAARGSAVRRHPDRPWECTAPPSFPSYNHKNDLENDMRSASDVHTAHDERGFERWQVSGKLMATQATGAIALPVVLRVHCTVRPPTLNRVRVRACAVQCARFPLGPFSAAAVLRA